SDQMDKPGSRPQAVQGIDPQDVTWRFVSDQWLSFGLSVKVEDLGHKRRIGHGLVGVNQCLQLLPAYMAKPAGKTTVFEESGNQFQANHPVAAHAPLLLEIFRNPVRLVNDCELGVCIGKAL